MISENRMTGLQRLGAFLKSPHHAWLALLTLGAGLATVSVPGLIVAAAAYALGWIFLPDSGRFRQWLQARLDTAGSANAAATAEQFRSERAKVYARLTPEGKSAYDALATAVEEVKSGFGAAAGTHAGRLGQLAWTYLRLLHTRETLAAFCAKESSALILEEIATAEAEVVSLETRALEAGTSGDAAGAGSLERLLQSKRSRLAGLEQHHEHVRKAENDLALTDAEIERLFDAVRLIQAHLVSQRDPDAMGDEIDRTTAPFHRTRDWLRDLEFDETPADISDDLTADLPLQVELTE